MNRNNLKKVVILGNHIQALGLSRMAARIGMEVTLYNSYAASVTRFSNTCKRFIVYQDKTHLMQMLLEKDNLRDTVILATNDDLIGLMADNYASLSEKYAMTIPRPEIVQIVFNKRETYQKAMDLGIPIPETHFPDTEEGLRVLAASVSYPIILKPAVMYTFHKATGQKVFFCRNEEELIGQYRKIIQIIPPEEVILQEFLSGGAPALYSFGSFFADGKVYGGFVANRIRQKPMDFGISTCFAHTVLNAEIERLATQFLSAIDYLGMSEVEFMYDKKNNVYKLLEINPRSWKWHSISNKLDINLFEMMIRFLEKQPLIPKMNKQANIGWVERLTDTYVVAGEILKGNMTIREYLRTMRLPKESAAWSWRDPLPAIMYLLMSPYLLIKRN